MMRGGCRSFETLREATQHCNTQPACTGVVHITSANPPSSTDYRSDNTPTDAMREQQRESRSRYSAYEVRSGTLIASATGSTSWLKQACSVEHSAIVAFTTTASIPAGGTIRVRVFDDSWAIDTAPTIVFSRPGGGRVHGTASWIATANILTITLAQDSAAIAAGAVVRLEVHGVSTLRSSSSTISITTFGTNTPNLALLQPTRQSSTDGHDGMDGMASLAVDGVENQDYAGGSC